MNNQPQKVEVSINDRIKFLISGLKMSARAFSQALEVSESTTRNYLDKGSKPSSDYIERIALHFNQVNVVWLVTGKGEPFLTTDSTQAQEANATLTHTKNFSHNQLISGEANTGTQQQGKGKRQVFTSHTHDDVAHLQALVEQLRSQLADKERTIQILLKQQSS